jgi:uncharacterized protein (TIGR03083 family)
MAAVLPALLDDLAAETAALDAVLVPLRPQEWARQTPAAGWNIADQVSHLAYFDETALLAAVDPARFRRHAQEASRAPLMDPPKPRILRPASTPSLRGRPSGEEVRAGTGQQAAVDDHVHLLVVEGDQAGDRQ